MTYEQEVWNKAVYAAEEDVIQACPLLIGGRKPKESPEAYAARGIKDLNHYLERLRIARKNLQQMEAEDE